MGREIRRVPPDWEHPKTKDGKFIPLFPGRDIAAMQAEWDEGLAKWSEGLVRECGDWIPASTSYSHLTFREWEGNRPKQSQYMPNWTPEEATHYMMYEDTTEGTPLSPAFSTPEEVARYCFDNQASAFGSDTASYEGWLYVAKGGFAPSCVGIPGLGLVNGVDAIHVPS